jgi:arginase
MLKYTVIDAPSKLGIRAFGVEMLPVALKSAGLLIRLNASYAGRVSPPPFNPALDPQTGILNAASIQSYSRQLADAIVPVVQAGDFPILLGGDCSILIGAMLGLRRVGRYGLFFVDAHADFYQPEAEPSGEVASMELAIVTGHGPDLLTNIEGLQPLVQEKDVVAFGYRDVKEAAADGSQDIRATAIHAYDLAQARTPDVVTAAQQALAHPTQNDLRGFWIHFDTDVLDDAIMPAVDYRLPGGLQWDEAIDLLRLLLSTNQAVGMSVTIFNPLLDDDGSIAQNLVETLVAGLTPPPS